MPITELLCLKFVCHAQAGTIMAWGPFGNDTCLSYQYNSSVALNTGIVNATSFNSWNPTPSGAIPAVNATTCSTANCTVNATTLIAKTEYYIAFENKQSQAAGVFALYAEGDFLAMLQS